MEVHFAPTVGNAADLPDACQGKLAVRPALKPGSGLMGCKGSRPYGSELRQV